MKITSSPCPEEIQALIDRLNDVIAQQYDHLQHNLEGIPPSGILFSQEAIEVNIQAVEALKAILTELKQGKDQTQRWKAAKFWIFKAFDVVYKGLKIFEMMQLDELFGFDFDFDDEEDEEVDSDEGQS